MSLEQPRTAAADFGDFSPLASEFDIPLGLEPLPDFNGGCDYGSLEVLFEHSAKEALSRSDGNESRPSADRPTMVEIDAGWFLEPTAHAA